MRTDFRSTGIAAIAIVLLLRAAAATSVPRLSFEELVDNSDVIVSGNVVRSWTAWDANRRYIWTHYEIAVKVAPKGTPSASLEIAEPGGIVDGIGMTVAGSVGYSSGENVVVFAQKMPNGYLRTTGWGQGKYPVDRAGLLHSDTSLRATDIVDTDGGALEAATPLRSLSGLSVSELTARVAARVRAQRNGKVQ